MKITVLGSAAAEGIPAAWCECPLCDKAAKLGGKDIRRRAAYLIDDDTLVDLGPDIFWQSVAFSFDSRKIKRILLTHPHEDHLIPMTLLIRKGGLSKVSRTIDIYAGEATLGYIAGSVGTWNGVIDMQKELKLNAHVMWQGRDYDADDMIVTPIEANHSPGKNPFILIIKRGNKSVLIGHDTGYLTEKSWQVLEGCKLDAAFLDCTHGLSAPDVRNNHMGANTAVEFRDRLADMKALNPEAKVFATHFSHNGLATHADFEAFFCPKGMGVAYDGMTLTL